MQHTQGQNHYLRLNTLFTQTIWEGGDELPLLSTIFVKSQFVLSQTNYLLLSRKSSLPFSGKSDWKKKKRIRWKTVDRDENM